MKKHPNVGSKVETTIKYDYAFTLSDYEKYLKDKVNHEPLFTKMYITNLLGKIKRILKGNRTVFKNWIPAPSNSRKEAEDKMDSVINFLSDKITRENVITLLKSNLIVDIRYDKFNLVTSLVTDSVKFNDLPSEIRAEVNKAITKFKDLNSDISILETVNFDKDISICKLKNVKTIVNQDEFLKSCIDDKPDYFDERGNKFEETVNKEVDAALETKPVTQVSTYWLFGIIPIWIRSKIVTQ